MICLILLLHSAGALEYFAKKSIITYSGDAKKVIKKQKASPKSVF